MHPVEVCPVCRATSVDDGQMWSRAGSCHLGPDPVDFVLFIPAAELDATLMGTVGAHHRLLDEVHELLQDGMVEDAIQAVLNALPSDDCRNVAR